MNVAPPVSASTLVIAAVSDVLPWSTCPIVPILQCGLFRSNFALLIWISPNVGRSGHLRPHFVGDRLRHRLIVIEVHRVGGTALAHRAQGVDVAEHVRE